MSGSAVVKALSGVVLDSVEPPALARFYAELLGWEIAVEDATWVIVKGPGDGTHLSFQLEPELQRPRWPSTHADQQMMIHLDFLVEDLAVAAARVTDIGGTLADCQPQKHVRVCADPEGHVFCLFVE